MLAGGLVLQMRKEYIYNLFRGVLQHCGALVFKPKPASQVSRGQSHLVDLSVFAKSPNSGILAKN